MFRLLILTTLMPLLLSPNIFADEKSGMDAMDKINYSVGHQIGRDFINQDVQMRPDMLLQGIEDAVTSTAPKMKKGEMRQVLLDLKKMVLAEEKARKENYRGEGRAFLAANAEKSGVITLPSGLQYKVLKQGDGISPTLDDQVTVNYVGTRLDGTEFDSSARQDGPVSFPVKTVIKGWTEALQLMHEGDKWQLFIPADLAYGEKGPLADQTVIFEVELIAVDKSKNNKKT